MTIFPSMRGIGLLILLTVLLFYTCKKDTSDDPAGYVYTVRITIKDNRIQEYSVFWNDSCIYKHEYVFGPGYVTMLNYYPSDRISDSIIYKIGSNGYAESSIEFPEPAYSATKPVYYSNRLSYFYDAGNHLTEVDVKAHLNDSDFMYYKHIGDTALIPKEAYEYSGGDRTRSKSLNVQINGPGIDPECLFTQYSFTDKVAKLDLSDNGILGKPGSHLVENELFGETCNCSPAISSNQHYFSYKLDKEGYVSQCKEIWTNCHSKEYSIVTIYNYQYTFIDK
jgi:hypothetical protein